jgi:hydrogenase maturation protein HypF
MPKGRPERASAPSQAARQRIRVRGIVQGVGFRPTVYRLATERGLAGWVLNDAEGVLLEVEGPSARIAEFLERLARDPPPLAAITAVETEDVPPQGETGFQIRPSAGGEREALVSPDVAVCPDCLRELLDPADRRFRYPFINCTHCGPRYSIILDVPYDRTRTTMRTFTMCRACRAEYEDPADRRFHAQPNACPACGPQLALRDAAGRPVATADPVRAVREALLAGRIVAIKGLTGFHLAADARNDAAVGDLRRRKGRDQKPFAMMAGSFEAVARAALVDEAERRLLESRERPIVLLRRRPDCGISPLVAPRSGRLGFMLPYAPIHYLLFEGDFPPLVMTSGNLSEEPICREDEEALQRLAGIADLYLLHDRPIQTVCDDSVAVVQRGRPLLLRRGRGHAPRPLALPRASPVPILAVGPELRNAVCLVRGRDAFVSQHVGDLKNALAAAYFEAAIEKLERLLEVRPAVIAHDLHPAYLSTRYARRRAERDAHGVRLVGVQHHHAHIAAVCAENGLEGDVIGLAMDGTGYGTDGTVWGGEVLRASAERFERLGRLEGVPLPGGDAAIAHPVRTAWSYLVQAFGPEAAEAHRVLLCEAALRCAGQVGALAEVSEEDRRTWTDMIARGLRSPRSSGLGRLFDAASVLAGIAAENTYEGQAAMELEAAAEGEPDEAEPYPFALRDPGAKDGAAWAIETGGLVRGLVADLERGAGAGSVAARFHATAAAMLCEAARRARAQTGLGRVALSGGCFANDRLVRLAAAGLEADGFQVYVHRDVPPGDGGVALGQAWVAAAGLRAEGEA